MAFTMTTAQKNAMLNTLSLSIGASGVTAAKLKIFDNTASPTGTPSNANSTTGSNVLLGTLTFSVLPFGGTGLGGATGGVLTAGPITQDSAADASGTALFYRIYNWNDVVLCQGSVGTSGAELNLNSTNIVIGGPVSVTSLTISI